MRKLIIKERLADHDGSCDDCKHSKEIREAKMLCLRTTIEVWHKRAKRFIYRSLKVSKNFICTHHEKKEEVA